MGSFYIVLFRRAQSIQKRIVGTCVLDTRHADTILTEGPPWQECVLSIRPATILAHRVASHLNPMGIMDQAVKDAIR